MCENLHNLGKILTLSHTRETHILEQFKKIFDKHDGGCWNWSILSINKTLPLYIVDAFIDKPWDWTALSCHPFLSWDFVCKHKQKPWNWSVLSSHRIVTCRLIMDNIDLDWDWSEISYNKNITWDFVQAFWFKGWDWQALCTHIKVTLAIISQSSYIQWSWSDLSYNEYFIQDIIDIRMRLSRFEESKSMLTHDQSIEYIHLKELWNLANDNLSSLDWSIICTHTCINLSVIRKCPKLPWDFHSLLYNPNLSWDEVRYVCKLLSKSLKYGKSQQDITSLIMEDMPSSSMESDNRNASSQFNHEDVDSIKSLSTFSSSLSLTALIPISAFLSLNELIPLGTIMNILEKYHELNIGTVKSRPFSYWELSCRSDMTIHFLKRLLQLNEYEHIPICWPALSRNANFTWSIIQENMSMPWCWLNLSLNPNITLDIVRAHYDLQWNWDALSCNRSTSLGILNRDLEKDVRYYSQSSWNWDCLSSFLNFYNIERFEVDQIIQNYLFRSSSQVSKSLRNRELGHPSTFTFLTNQIACVQGMN